MGSLTQVDFTGGQVVSSLTRGYVFAALLNQLQLVMCVQYGYRMGKAALHIAGATLARDFKQRGIPVGLIHPGVVSLALISSHNFLSILQSLSSQIVATVAPQGVCIAAGS